MRSAQKNLFPYKGLSDGIILKVKQSRKLQAQLLKVLNSQLLTEISAN